ncbi:MAG: hypothetical protein QM490_03180 [Candidatus Gracilibacteria bacterium]
MNILEWKNNKIPVFQGYILGFENSIENIIGRGYTDATASKGTLISKNKNPETTGVEYIGGRK